jgi:hypothetical protein
MEMTTYPVLRINDQSVIRFDSRRDLQTIPCFALKRREFTNCFFLDANSRMFRVKRIENLRASWNPIKLLEKHRKCVVIYHLENPVDLGFDKARDIVINEILKKNRFSQGGETKDQFVQRIYGYGDMLNMIKSISLYGETWY